MPILGIDLGTTNSACGVWRNKGVTLIPNRLGDELTPSIVGVDEKGNVIVGRTAKDSLLSKPDHTVAAVKRLIGTKHEIQLGKRKFTPTEISSLILQSLKEDAETYLGEEVIEAVISVPAYFNDNQRHATKQAAELAGLRVSRLINEPTAAALAYGLQEKEDGTFIVLDMGGGTFDVSILEYFDGIMEVHASSGDNFLGGEDFTEAVMKDFLSDNTLDVDGLKKSEKQELLRKSDKVKIDVNKGQASTLSISLSGQDYQKAYSPEIFSKIALSLLTRIKRPIETALRDAGLRASELDDVILVGGATRMSALRNAVGKMFSRIPSCNIDPDKVVAIGAAIQAGLKEKNEDLDDVVLTDVCPYTLGVEVVNPMNEKQAGYFLPIIERNRTVPVSVVETLGTVQNNQKEINVSIYQGESRNVTRNICLGEMHILIPRSKAGEETIDVRYSYDMNGLLEVDVTVNSTGKKHSKVIEQAPGALSAKEKEKARKRLAELKFHPREQEENQSILAKGEMLYEMSKGEIRQEISLLLAEFEQVLDKQKVPAIDKAREALKTHLSEYEYDQWS